MSSRQRRKTRRARTPSTHHFERFGDVLLELLKSSELFRAGPCDKRERTQGEFSRERERERGRASTERRLTVPGKDDASRKSRAKGQLFFSTESEEEKGGTRGLTR